MLNGCLSINVNDVFLSAFMPSISVVSLYGQLQQKPDDVIVLDCRPSAEQSACHVNYKHFQQWIEIPEETITSGYGLQNKYKHSTRTHHTLV